MSLIEYDLNQLPPMDECLLGNTDNIPAHLVFGQDEPVSDPEAWVHLQMMMNLHKEWIFMIVASHKLCKVDVSLYVYT